MNAKLFSKILFVLLLTPLVVSAQAPPPPPPPALDYSPKLWKEFESADGGFRVRFPGTPKEDTETKADNVVLHALAYGSDKFIFYSVSYRDLQDEKDANEYLQSVRDTRLLGMEGKMKLLSEKKTIRDGQPALLLDFDLTPDRRMRELDVIRGRRHYNLIVITFSNHSGIASDDAYGEIANRFLDSFHLIDSRPKSSSVH